MLQIPPSLLVWPGLSTELSILPWLTISSGTLLIPSAPSRLCEFWLLAGGAGAVPFAGGDGAGGPAAAFAGGGGGAVPFMGGGGGIFPSGLCGPGAAFSPGGGAGGAVPLSGGGGGIPLIDGG